MLVKDQTQMFVQLVSILKDIRKVRFGPGKIKPSEFKPLLHLDNADEQICQAIEELAKIKPVTKYTENTEVPGGNKID